MDIRRSNFKLAIFTMSNSFFFSKFAKVFTIRQQSLQNIFNYDTRLLVYPGPELSIGLGGGGGGGCNPKKPNAPANFKFGTVFFSVFFRLFSVFPFWQILIDLTGSC